MPKVVISARASHMVSPSFCACCGGPANTEIADAGYKQTKGRRGDPNMCTVKFPVCSPCLQHRAAEASFFGSPVRSPTCEAKACFADYVGWSGTTHTFLFDSPRFARAFAEANRSQGRNVLSVDLSGAPAVNNPPPAYVPGAQAPPAWTNPGAYAAPPAPSTPVRPAVIMGVVIGICVLCCLSSLASRWQDNTPRVYVTPQGAPPPVRVSPAPGTPTPPAIAVPSDAGHQHRHHHRGAP